MEAFRLTLSNSTTVTGILNIPARTPNSPKHLPLIIGVHGVCYTAEYFDTDEANSARPLSGFFGIPFVSINRAGYKGSSSLCPLPEGTDLTSAYAHWLDGLVLPALWKKYGEPAGCTCLVIYGHSLGSGPTIFAAAQHGRVLAGGGRGDYPLGGIIFTGVGAELRFDPSGVVDFPVEMKNSALLLPGTCDPSVYGQTERMSHAMPDQESARLATRGPRWWEEAAAPVAVPVLYAVAGRDPLVVATNEAMAEFAGAFKNSPKFEGVVIAGAPHNIEQSYWSQAWYARCFGFAMECAASMAIADA